MLERLWKENTFRYMVIKLFRWEMWVTARQTIFQLQNAAPHIIQYIKSVYCIPVKISITAFLICNTGDIFLYFHSE